MRAWLRNNRGLLLFLLAFGLLRTAIADYNPIPSGSMRPTLLEGDVVFVNRLAYDVKIPLTDIALAATGEPRRGDIVTFSSPKDGRRLIKRVVGLPGDTIALRRDVLYVNGVAARYSHAEKRREPAGEPYDSPAIRVTALHRAGAAPAHHRADLASARLRRHPRALDAAARSLREVPRVIRGL